MKSIVFLLLSLPLLAADRKLVWQDEFEGSGVPDPAKWGYEEGYIRNKEAQLYTKENARIVDGVLVIEARKQTDGKITSASVRSKGKAEWKYGRIEVRAKLPTGRGTWPAIWMLGSNCDRVGWPTCGEIDIMENVGFAPGVIHANIHTQAYNHVKKTGKGNKIEAGRPWADFHVYALEWTPEKMDFLFDDNKYFTYVNDKAGEASWPFDQPFYLILNVAIGGAWGGQKGIDDSIFPQKMEIDYVRVYQ